MELKKVLENVNQYFDEKLKIHGTEAKGVDWNSNQAREIRFDQLVKIVEPDTSFSMLDYGAGYGAFYDYLIQKENKVRLYYGYDLLESMVLEGRKLHEADPNAIFTSDLSECPPVDYVSACGVFNMKLNADYDQWTKYVVKCMHEINDLAEKGFSINFLTKYSDADRMRDDLYYADPCYLFDYCKLNFSRNVALLHDYEVYDFTLLIRK